MNIGAFIKNSFVDYPGHIASVIFTNGCNFNCWYCHNKSLIKGKENIEFDEILQFLKTRQGLIEGVVISGGEPTLQNDLLDKIRLIKELGYKIKLDTNGTNSSILQKLIEEKLVDYVAMDIKAPLDKYSEIICCNFKTDEILKSIEILKENRVDYEFRTTFSPDLETQDMEKIFAFIKNCRYFYLQKHIPQQNSSLKEHSLSDFEICSSLAKKYGIELKFRNL